MSARISIDLDDTPGGTVEVDTGSGHPTHVWIKLRGETQPSGEQERYEVWLTPAQALSLFHGLGDVLTGMNVATIEAAEVDIPVTVPGNTFPAMNS